MITPPMKPASQSYSASILLRCQPHKLGQSDDLDGPCVLKSGQKATADPKAEIRPKTGSHTQDNQ
jgi:hypothetical protein